ncbi:hypothetical protein [Govanella unica]|uniref:N-acetyltransferase n=1 Tax=Govanella unica TaxID=2975056 RepID=A0A9X3TYD0_9PROT|nr:hypothetical protein [Govania unica]MDA5193642.1 hypothetical protein [Govania unica]
METLRIEPVKTGRQLNEFIHLSRALYAGDPSWVPPLAYELKERLHPNKNPYFQHAELQAFIAYRGRKAIGRITAQVDHLVPEHHGEQIGHFGFFDVADDDEAARALLSTAENWLRSFGKTRVLGPYNPTLNEEPGVLVDGFSKPPMMLMGHSLPYTARQLEQAGYEKAKDLYAYYVDIRSDVIPESIKKLTNRYVKDGRLEFRSVQMSRYQQDLDIILEIFNDAWSGNWGYLPMTEAELKHTADGMKVLVREELTYIAYFEGKPVGMMVTLPNLNEILKTIDGKLFPFGWLRLLKWLKIDYPISLRVPLMGVMQDIQNSPLGAAVSFGLIEKIRCNAAARGSHYAELSWILEDNLRMRGILDKIHSVPYKTYRVYGKELG